MRWLFGLFVVLVAAQAAADEQPRLYLEDFRLGHAPGAVRVASWRELDPDRAEAQALSGCRALGWDCSEEPDPARAAARFIKPEIVVGAYRGTALVLRRRGQSYYAKFAAPPGHTICKAGIDLVGGYISPGAVFAGAIQRIGRDGLGIYAALPQASHGSAAIAFRLMIATVPTVRFDRDTCWPDGTIVFLCPGSTRCQPSRAYPETDLR
ncbi:hypothetical protein [Kaistia granuli]|uniref:hypothetical protein n=1 Tax=Kaistia granuli TaxID=363259 RepID=UPI00036ED7DD|nr:hypothetical protein [Kaistia granuli]